MARDNDSSAFVLGMLLGTAAGVVVTLFTAPRSGEETIDGLRSRANRLLGRVEDAGTRAYDWATEPVREAPQDWPGETYATGTPPAAWPVDEEPLPEELQEVVDAFEAAPDGEDLLDDLAATAEDLLDDVERDTPA